MQNAYDPASYLRSEIAAYDAGLRPNWEPWQRAHYLEVLLVDHDQEVAWITGATSHRLQE